MMGALQFFELVEEWLPQMREIDELSFPAADQWEDAFYDSIFTRPDLRAFGRSVEGRLTGYALLEEAASGMRLRSFAIHPAHRRMGYGKALLQRIVERGRGDIELMVDAQNAPAIRLYERFGFKFEDGGGIFPVRRVMRLSRPARFQTFRP